MRLNIPVEQLGMVVGRDEQEVRGDTRDASLLVSELISHTARSVAICSVAPRSPVLQTLRYRI